MTMTNAPHGVLINHDFNSQIEIDNKTHWVSRPDQLLKSVTHSPEHIGTKGDRVCFFLKLIRIMSTSRGFEVYTFKDEVENVFVAFSHEIKAGDPLVAIECDTCYIIKATIKRHAVDTYGPGQGHFNQNVINRLMVLKTMGKKEV